MKNVCFVANYNKTYFFDAVAQCMLTNNDVNIYWIAVNEKIYSYLVKKYGANSVLKISNLDSAPDTCLDISLNEIIYSDRVLKKNIKKSSFYLKGISLKILDFIKKESISCFFGELTWGHEILIKRICEVEEGLNCKYLNPHTIRIPYSRFALFNDEFQSCFINGSSEDFYLESDSFYTEKLDKPDYLKINDKLISERNKFFSKLRRIFSFVFCLAYNDKNDPTQESRFNRLLVHWQNYVRKKSYRFVEKDHLDNIKEKKFIFYAFHKQPEASIDFFGRYYEDQYLNILNLWRRLPDNYFLVVKEHTNALGDRGFLFYRKIKKLNGLVVVDEKADSHEIIDLCDAVFTVTGTIAYEAALKGKLSYTFSDTFFNKLSLCNRITLEDLRNIKSLQEIFRIHYENYDIENDKLVFNNLMINSFKGIISDSVSDPRCMIEENVKDVSNALLRVI